MSAKSIKPVSLVELGQYRRTVYLSAGLAMYIWSLAGIAETPAGVYESERVIDSMPPPTLRPYGHGQAVHWTVPDNGGGEYYRSAHRFSVEVLGLSISMLIASAAFSWQLPVAMRNGRFASQLQHDVA